MPSFHELSIPDLLRDARDLYTNARDDAEVFAVLSAEPWAFTADDFDAGLGLVAAVEEALETEAREKLERGRATNAYGKAVRAVEKVYARHRGVLRSRIPRTAPEYRGLGLAGEAPDDREDLLKDAADFYGTLAAQPDLVAATRGISDAGIAEARGLIEAARKAGTVQTREVGEAQRAQKDQQDAVEALRKHAALTASDAAAALADHAQLRERLGLLDRS